MPGTLILMTKTWLGHVEAGDRAFGGTMLDRFLHTLETSAEKPAAIAFYTDGVKLVVTGSPVLLGLKVLEDAGVRLLVCQSCLHYYDLEGRVAVGTVAGMTDIVAAMAAADRVITV
jgi:hypothetical protein